MHEFPHAFPVVQTRQQERPPPVEVLGGLYVVDDRDRTSGWSTNPDPFSRPFIVSPPSPTTPSNSHDSYPDAKRVRSNPSPALVPDAVKSIRPPGP